MPADEAGSGMGRGGSRHRGGWQVLVKRAIDVVGSLCLLVLLAPVILLAAALVRLGSPGPAFYAGRRYGFASRQFACFKLRSMVTDQVSILARDGLSAAGSQGRLLVFDDDPRITRVGAVLRKLSIDELPQLVNVLRGDMSLVGPRPLALSMLEDYAELGSARAVVRPGITGLWQVRNRAKNASVLDMIDDDLEYISRFGLLLDLRIMLATLTRIVEPELPYRTKPPIRS